jgi:hypothetical protein
MFSKSFREILKWTERVFAKGIAHFFPCPGKETCGFKFEIGFMKPYFMGFDPPVTLQPYIFCYIPFPVALFLIFIIFYIHFYNTIILSFIIHQSPRPVFLYPHRFLAQQEEPPWVAEPRLELGPALQPV